MTNHSDLVKRLRALARCQHDDLSIGDEAADEITSLRSLLDKAKGALENLLKENEFFEREEARAVLAEMEGE